MSETAIPLPPEPSGRLSSVVIPDQIRGKSGGIEVVSNSETADEIKANFEGAEKPKDGPDAEEQEAQRVSEAARELGKKGAEARRAKADQRGGFDSTDADRTGDGSTDEGTGVPDDKKPVPEKLGKPRDDPKARMLEATRKEAEAKKERDQAKKEKEELAAKFEELRKKVEATREQPVIKEPKPAPGKPDPAQFKTTEEWLDARDKWNEEQLIKRLEEKHKKEQEVAAYAKTIDEQLAKATAARKEYEKKDPQFSEKVSDEVKALANNPSFARDVNEPLKADHVIADEIILSAEAGPLLMLHFTENPDELKRIQALRTPQEIQVEMRVLARAVKQAEPTKADKAIAAASKAKPPIKPLAGAPAGGEDEIPGDEASVEQHFRVMDKKAPWRMRKVR
jgi:hypothetical protein